MMRWRLSPHAAPGMSHHRHLGGVQFVNRQQNAAHHASKRMRNNRPGVFHHLYVAVAQSHRLGQQFQQPRIHAGKHDQLFIGKLMGEKFSIFPAGGKIAIMMRISEIIDIVGHDSGRWRAGTEVIQRPSGENDRRGCQDDCSADKFHLLERRDIHDHATAIKQPKHENAQFSSDDRAFAAKQTRAADDYRGDDGQIARCESVARRAVWRSSSRRLGPQ